MKIKNVMMLTMSVLLVILASVSFAQTASLKSDNWVLLGSRQVDYTLDRDVITLKESEPLTALKFSVNNGPINLHKCTVHFASGETQDVSFSASEDAGQLIDLKGNTRKIEKVTFWYDTKNSSDKKAVVEVWGKKSQGT